MLSRNARSSRTEGLHRNPRSVAPGGDPRALPLLPLALAIGAALGPLPASAQEPDPSDERHVTDYAFLLREDGEVRAVHDRHEYGLFPEAVWVELAQGAGFHVETVTRPLPDEYATSAYTGTMFLGRRP